MCLDMPEYSIPARLTFGLLPKLLNGNTLDAQSQSSACNFLRYQEHYHLNPIQTTTSQLAGPYYPRPTSHSRDLFSAVPTVHRLSSSPLSSAASRQFLAEHRGTSTIIQPSRKSLQVIASSLHSLAMQTTSPPKPSPIPTLAPKPAQVRRLWNILRKFSNPSRASHLGD